MVLQKFFPKLVAKVYSPINGEISVVEQFGRRKIVVSGLTQSGPMAEEVWGVGVQHINMLTCCTSNTINNILILGLGGGSLVKLLSEYFPQAKIVGVDLDPTMVDLGKKYLHLSSFKSLKIVIDDATTFVKKINKKFDLIFVDLYVGDNVPKNCQTKKFLKNLKKTLKKNGIIVFNRLYYQNHVLEAKIFLDKLEKIFDDLDCKKILTNLLVFVRR